jgi:hypothetical protein
MVRMNDYTKNISQEIFNPGDHRNGIEFSERPPTNKKSGAILKANLALREYSAQRKSLDIQNGRRTADRAAEKSTEKMAAEKRMLMKLRSKIEKSETRADTST